MELVQPASSTGVAQKTPAFRLPSELVDRAATAMCWITAFCAITSFIFIPLEHLLQPEMAGVFQSPSQRLILLLMVFVSLGFILLIRTGAVSKYTLLDVGTGFRVFVAFVIGWYETALPIHTDHPVRGLSAIALWIILTSFFMPNSPLKTALAVIASASAWPVTYLIHAKLNGYPSPPINRMLVWLLPIAMMSIWAYVVNSRMLQMYLSNQKAEEMGSYKLDYVIGKGGMGEVWHARHRMLFRDAAVKLIRAEVLAGLNGRQETMMRKRFEREAQATASLRSPHTVDLFDFGMTKDNAFYYAMELLDGVDLQTMVERYGPLHPGRVRKILMEVCESLEEAHHHGIIHRDIKPKNIFLSRLGLEYDFTKVLDFGLAKSIFVRDMSLMTLEGVATGTPAYLAPEIAMGEADVDGRADIYSLGCVAYFLLTGQLVFNEPSPTALALAHVQKQPIPLSERTELPIPAGLEAIVMKMLSKEKSARPRSAEELSRMLKSLMDVPEWTAEDAKVWWQTNLPEVAEPVICGGNSESESTSEFAVMSTAKLKA